MIRKILGQPLAYGVSVVLALIFGVFFPQWNPFFSSLGEIYFSFLKMCVIPLLMTLILANIGKFLFRKERPFQLGRCVLFILGVFVLVAVLGVGIGMTFRVGHLNESGRVEMSEFIGKEEVVEVLEPEEKISTQPNKSAHESFLVSFLSRMIPSNIFVSLEGEEIFKIVVFSIFLGLAIGLIREAWQGNLIRNIFELEKAFYRIIDWLKPFLPFGAFCLLAPHFSLMKQVWMSPLSYFLMVYFLSVIGIVLINSFFLSRMAKVSFFQSIYALKEMLFAAWSSKSSLLGFPFGTEGLQEKLKIPKEVASVGMPIGVAFCPYGIIFTFAIQAVFLIQIYQAQWTVWNVGLIIGHSIGMAIITPRISPMITIAVLNVISPLGLPLKPAHILFSFASEMLSPLGAILNLHIHCVVLAVVGKFFYKRQGH